MLTLIIPILKKTLCKQKVQIIRHDSLVVDKNNRQPKRFLKGLPKIKYYFTGCPMSTQLPPLPPQTLSYSAHVVTLI